MGYRIEYSNSSPKREIKRKSGRKWIAALLVVVLIICVQQYWPQGTLILQGILFPVDMDDVQSGWTCFVQQLQKEYLSFYEIPPGIGGGQWSSTKCFWQESPFHKIPHMPNIFPYS